MVSSDSAEWHYLGTEMVVAGRIAATEVEGSRSADPLLRGVLTGTLGLLSSRSNAACSSILVHGYIGTKGTVLECAAAELLRRPHPAAATGRATDSRALRSRARQRILPWSSGDGDTTDRKAKTLCLTMGRAQRDSYDGETGSAFQNRGNSPSLVPGHTGESTGFSDPPASPGSDE